MAFGNDNRYGNTPVYTVQRADGTYINVYEQRDLLVTQSNTTQFIPTSTRLDLIAYDLYGDETRYWALVDNSAQIDPFLILANPATVILPTAAEVASYLA